MSQSNQSSFYFYSKENALVASCLLEVNKIFPTEIKKQENQFSFEVLTCSRKKAETILEAHGLFDKKIAVLEKDNEKKSVYKNLWNDFISSSVFLAIGGSFFLFNSLTVF